MRFASLGSGSEGNALVVECKQSRVLLDCGFNLKHTLQRLNSLGLRADQLSGILLTHEHEDHASGAIKLASKFDLSIWLTHGSYVMLHRHLPNQHNIQFNIIDPHHAFGIGDIEVQPYPVPHDAREPVQFTFSDGHFKLGVLTDTGSSTPHIENRLSGCHALVLECNHDLTMLQNGAYPWALKKRISSRLGHLDNNAAADLLSRLDNAKLQHLIAAHLSASNNTPSLAQAALSRILGCESNWIGVANQAEGFAWREIM